jgi:hypothetical protein
LNTRAGKKELSTGMLRASVAQAPELISFAFLSLSILPHIRQRPRAIFARRSFAAVLVLRAAVSGSSPEEFGVCELLRAVDAVANQCLAFHKAIPKRAQAKRSALCASHSKRHRRRSKVRQCIPLGLNTGSSMMPVPPSFSWMPCALCNAR